MSKQFGTQFFGYNKKDVDHEIEKKQLQIEKMNLEIENLNRIKDDLESKISILEHRVNITESSNEEISRLALKEASELIEKAKKNASMILKESLDYVRTLNEEVEGYKEKAIAFRSDVQKISQDLINTIDESELFYLINEEKNLKNQSTDAEE